MPITADTKRIEATLSPIVVSIASRPGELAGIAPVSGSTAADRRPRPVVIARRAAAPDTLPVDRPLRFRQRLGSLLTAVERAITRFCTHSEALFEVRNISTDESARQLGTFPDGTSADRAARTLGAEWRAFRCDAPMPGTDISSRKHPQSDGQGDQYPSAGVKRYASPFARIGYSRSESKSSGSRLARTPSLQSGKC
jgi:mRNA-degrading endonuclease toxin of MazEF toxin-antitoxin module